MVDRLWARFNVLRGDRGFMELIRGSGLVLFFKILGGLSAYIFTLVIGRVFGADGYGVFEVCFTILMIAGTFSRLGLEGVWIRFFPQFKIDQSPAKFKALVRQSIALISMVSVIIGIAVFLFSGPLSEVFHSPSLKVPFQITGLILPIYVILSLLTEGFRAMKRMKAFSVLQNGSALLLAVIFVPILLPMDIQEDRVAIIAYGISVLILTMIGGWFFHRSLDRQVISGVRRKVDMNAMLRISIPIMLTGALFYIINWTDTLMLQYFMNETNVGVYQGAFRVATLITFSQFAINSVFAPMISSYFAESDMSSMRRLIRQVGALNFSFSVPVFLILVLFPETVLGLFGMEFKEGAGALGILAISQLFNALSGPNLYILNITGKEKVAQRIMALVAVMNILLNLWLIPLHGIMGAALASTVSMVIWNIFATWYVYRYYRIITLSFLDAWIHPRD